MLLIIPWKSVYQILNTDTSTRYALLFKKEGKDLVDCTSCNKHAYHENND